MTSRKWEGRAAGKSIEEATVEACHTRFRPILMTSFRLIIRVLPLVFASGTGASARKSLGLAITSGMIDSTCRAVLFVPAFYVVLQRWWNGNRFKLAAPSNSSARELYESRVARFERCQISGRNQSGRGLQSPSALFVSNQVLNSNLRLPRRRKSLSGN
jgi:hypothetical protein